MGVSKNRGTPKWMVEIMENLIKMDDLGVPLFLVQHPYFAAMSYKVGPYQLQVKTASPPLHEAPIQA